jgi:DNA-binding transcriptional LysR family regulator
MSRSRRFLLASRSSSERWGAPVVDRGRGGLVLTPVGEEAMRRGSAILAQAEDLVQAARSAGDR